jgi:hypothetical protein
MKKKTMAGLIAIVAVVAVVISVGAVYKEEKSAPVSTQDLKYLDWVSETSALEYSHLESLDEARNRLLEGDGAYERLCLADMGRYAGMVYGDANKALSEIDRFSVSPKLKPYKDEFKLAQQDLKWAAYYMERGARNIDTYDIKTSSEYFKRFYEHLERGVALLPEEYSMFFKP